MFKVLFIFSGHDFSYGLRETRMELEEKYPGEFSLEFLDTYELDGEEEKLGKCLETAESCDFIFICMHGGITYFKGFDKILTAFEGRKRFFIYSGVEDENAVLLKKSGISKIEYDEILRYYLMGGSRNNLNMTFYMASAFGGVKYGYTAPESPGWEGIYYPEAMAGDCRRSTDRPGKADKPGRTDRPGKANKPVVGILFYSQYLHEDNLRHIDALIKEVGRLGGEALAVYTTSAPNAALGCKGIQWVIDNILMDQGCPAVDVIINTLSHAQSILGNPGDGSTAVEISIFEQMGVPVLQAMGTYQSLEDWNNSIRGLDSMSLAGSVYYPEFDGQIISVPVAYMETRQDKAGKRNVFMPIAERVEKVCRLAMNWAGLRKIPQLEKKIAVILHNMPPRNDMIGCAFGLDTPRSVWNMVEALKKEGIHTEYDFADGDDIIGRIIDAVSNDTRWLPAEKVLEKSVDVIRGDLYREWFSLLSKPVRDKMTGDWGSPPGEFMVYEDRLPVPGILNGNIFIGLQPARGLEEKAEEVYHSTDIVPPHQYIAFYRWVKHVFGAHAIVHVGTHGTLEWLPGKEVGLSGDCYPDIAIDDMPHLYPYIINVPGEGIQVKRRSYGVILDHLIPSLVQSGLYEEMARMDDLIKQYYHAKQGDKGKLPDIRKQIVELACKNNFHQDLQTEASRMENEFSSFADRLHAWLEEIKNSLVKDGLHIFGEAPAGQRLTNLIASLLRLPNGEIPSLPEAVCKAWGMDYQYLKAHPDEEDDHGKTNFMLLDGVEEKCGELITALHRCGYAPERIGEVINGSFTGGPPGDPAYLEKSLEFVCNTVKPRLDAVSDEIRYFVEGVNGSFVPPGGSGCPTRGRVSILPTGRNFYSIDPAAVPTKAAWEVGVRLGDGLLERYLQDEGKYPESIVMVIYGGETMKTCGDDIAEALYLMGVKPKWLEGSDRVIGLEVIPYEGLRRPRIDVTLRITGLFRDTFPNLIELVEDAVNLAAGLDEDTAINYVRRNILQDIKKLKSEGLSEEDAEQQAGMRIFGCPPGTYGAGVDILINSKNWQDTEDLGNVYTTWGGHAYGRKVHGIKAREVFAARLAKAEATVKNESSMEIDMLDSDDFYNYHGGLIAAVKTHSGKMPRGYGGDSSDPSRTKIRGVNEETARIMRARIMNPKWFEGLKKHGYKGAQEIAAMVDIVFGWDATSGVVEDWMYDRICETYLFDDERREWIKSVNKWAVHSMTERLLEANQRGMWNTAEENLEKLRGLYLDIEGNIEEAL